MSSSPLSTLWLLPPSRRWASAAARLLATTFGVLLATACMTPAQMSDMYRVTNQTNIAVGQLKTSQGEVLARLEFSMREIDKKLVDQDRYLRNLKEDLEKQIGALRQEQKQATGSAAGVPTEAVALPSVPPPPTEEEMSSYNAADAELKKKGYDAAIEKFTEFLTQYPNSSKAPEAAYGLGKACYEKGDYEPARQAFDRIATQYPMSTIVPQGLLSRALCEYQLSQFPAARLTLERLKQTYPDYETQRVDTMLKKLP